MEKPVIKVCIDFEKFKDVLGEFFTEDMIFTIIGSMNDNDVFIDSVED